MSILGAGIRLRQSLLGDQVRRGLVGLGVTSVALILGPTGAPDHIVLTLDPDADPQSADLRLAREDAIAARVFVAPSILISETADHITIGV